MHARALLTSSRRGRCAYVDADVRDPRRILAEAAATLDFTRPVAVMMLGLLHFIPDVDDPYSLARYYMDAVPPRQLPGRLACVQRHQSGPAGGGGGKLQRPLRHPARPVAPGEAAAGPAHLPPTRPGCQTLIAGRRCASAWPPEASQGMRNV
jgi:hypothetical protein